MQTVLVALVAVIFMVVTGGAGRQQRGPVGQRAGVDQAIGAGRPLQRAQPAVVVTPALPGRMGRLPGPDFADQRLAEVLPVDQACLVEGQRQPERPALPRCGEHQLAVVAWWARRAGAGEEGGRVGVPAGPVPGAATTATPTM